MTTHPPNLTFNAGQLPDEQSSLVGLFIARWSLAEFSLLIPVMHAAGVTQEVAAVLLANTTSAGAKIDVAKSIVSASSLIDQKQTDKINKAINKLYDLVKDRNAVAHHLWAK